jgi:serine/threonine-protein kinase
MTEEIINALVQVPDLRVAARTSVFAFKGKPDDLRTIAGKLNVRTVLEGSVRKAGNKIRITAQLINAADGFHLWAEKFDRGLDDIFAVQDEIARTIAERLKAKLAGGARQQLVVAPTADIEAYQLYLQGRFFWNQRGGGLMKGLKCFEAALAKDPNYAAAHGGVADAYVLMAFYGYVRAKDVVPLARSAAQRALELEPEMPEAQSALAFVTGVFDLQVDASYRAYRRVVETHPKFVPARYWRASTESVCGRHHEGVRLAEEAVRLEPHSLIANALFAWVSITARTGRAVELARHVLAMEPNFMIGRWVLGIALLAENQFDESIAELRQAVEISQQLPWMVGTYGCALAYAGRTAEARLVLEQLSQRARTGYVPAYALFLLHAYLREERTALDLLEQAIADGDAGICYFGIVVAWPTPMGLPEQYMNRDTRAAYAQRLGLQLV